MSKTEKVLGFGVLIAIVIAVGAFLQVGGISVGTISPNDLTSTNFTQLTASDGLAVGTSQQFQVSSVGAVTAGAISATTGAFSGDVTIPTVQGATSTLIVGQVQTYATSAATVVCQKYLEVATTSANGFVTWSYGVCP